MDIYRICSLGKALTETIEEVVRDPTEQLKNKIWRLYDSCLEEEMAKLKDHDATINGSLETFQRIPLENSNNNKQVCRLVIKDPKISFKQNSSANPIQLPPQSYLKIVAYEKDEGKTKSNKKKPTK